MKLHEKEIMMCSSQIADLPSIERFIRESYEKLTKAKTVTIHIVPSPLPSAGATEIAIPCVNHEVPHYHYSVHVEHDGKIARKKTAKKEQVDKVSK